MLRLGPGRSVNRAHDRHVGCVEKMKNGFGRLKVLGSRINLGSNDGKGGRRKERKGGLCKRRTYFGHQTTGGGTLEMDSRATAPSLLYLNVHTSLERNEPSHRFAVSKFATCARCDRLVILGRCSPFRGWKDQPRAASTGIDAWCLSVSAPTFNLHLRSGTPHRNTSLRTWVYHGISGVRSEVKSEAGSNVLQFVPFRKESTSPPNTDDAESAFGFSSRLGQRAIRPHHL